MDIKWDQYWGKMNWWEQLDFSGTYWKIVRSTSTDRCKLTADKVVMTSSPLYKLTFFPTDLQTNLPQTHVITVPEERAWEFLLFCDCVTTCKQ